MANDKCFKLSEVVLGLRNEYKKTASELEIIKNHLKLEEGVTSEVGIYSYLEFSKKDPKTIDAIHSVMIIELTKKLSFLEKLLKAISFKNLSYDEMYNYVSDFRKHHYSVNDKTLFEVDDMIKFTKDCDAIMNSDFNSGLLDRYLKGNEKGLNIKLGHNGIYAVTDLRSQTQPVVGVDYRANCDQLVLNNYYNDPMFTTKARDLLDTQLYSCLFSDGLADIIRNNPISQYPIKFEGLDNSKFEQRFDLEVKSDHVLAKRVEKKKEERVK